MLPPTPTPTTAKSAARVTKFGEPPAAIAKTPDMPNVILYDHLVSV